MATAIIPEKAQFSEEADRRNNLLSSNMTRLQHIAYRGLAVRNWKNDEFIIVMIEVDSQWRALADRLVPNENWQNYRDQGLEPFAQGSASWATCNVIAKLLPNIADVVMEKPSDGMIKAIVLTDDGGTVFEIEPKPESDHT